MTEINWDLLKPTIKSILEAPGVDLSTISAKKVRKEIATLGQFEGLDIKKHKEEIDLEIVSQFQQIRRKLEESAPPPPPPTPLPPKADLKPTVKRKRTPSPSHIKEETDEELARRLHLEMNGGSSRRTRAAPTKATPKKRKVVKSRKMVDDDDLDGEDGEHRENGEKEDKKKGTGFNKLMRLSEQMREVVGVEQLSRPQVVKQLWVYIKLNELQDPNHKQDILCDDKLKALFKMNKVNSFKMNKYISAHLFPID